MNINPKSVFRRGAEDGAWFGLYLSVMFIFVAYSMTVPLLGHLATLMALGVPIYTFITLRKGFIDNGCFYTFAELWTYGIMLFACGSLIMAATIILYISGIYPTFIYDQCQIAIDAYKSIGGEMGNEIASTLEKAIELKQLPTPFELATNILSFNVFSGSILSIILAPIIRHFRPKGGRTQNFTNQQ